MCKLPLIMKDERKKQRLGNVCYTEEQQERAGSCEDVTDPYVEVPVAGRITM